MSLNTFFLHCPLLFSSIKKIYFQSENSIFHGIVEMFTQQVPWDESLGWFEAFTIKKKLRLKSGMVTYTFNT